MWCSWSPWQQAGSSSMTLERVCVASGGRVCELWRFTPRKQQQVQSKRGAPGGKGQKRSTTTRFIGSFLRFALFLPHTSHTDTTETEGVFIIKTQNSRQKDDAQVTVRGHLQSSVKLKVHKPPFSFCRCKWRKTDSTSTFSVGFLSFFPPTIRFMQQ